MHNFEDFSDRAVPENEGPRFKALYLFNVEAAVAVCVPVFLFGASLGTSLGGKDLFFTLFISVLCLSALVAWSSYIGVKTRLSTPLLVQKAFGSLGAHIVWALVGLSLFGWFGVQTEIFAKAFLALLHEITPEVSLNVQAVTFISGLIMSSTAILGIKGVGKLAQLSVPLLFLVLLYSFYEAFNLEAFKNWWHFVPAHPAAIGPSIAAVIGGYSVGVIVMPDVKRFAFNKAHAISAGVSSIGLFYPLLLLIAALIAFFTKEPDLMRVFVAQGFGPLALFILMLATWTTNDINLYSASLNIAPLFPKMTRTSLTALCGLLGSITATFGLFEHMIALFSLLGVFTTPLLAIYSFYYLTRRTQTQDEKRTIRPQAFLTWAFSSCLGFSTTPTDQLGLGLFSFTSVPVLDSFLASFFLYSLVYFSLRAFQKES